MDRTVADEFHLPYLFSFRLFAKPAYGMVHLDSGDFRGLRLSVGFADSGSRFHFGFLGYRLSGDWSAQMSNRVKRIAVSVEHVRGWGRRVCEGIASFARGCPDWTLTMFEDGVPGKERAPSLFPECGERDLAQ